MAGEENHQAMLGEARAIGRKKGEAAASWIFNGNTSRETYRKVLKGIQQGDPVVMDAYDPPNMSGEFADSYDEKSLLSDLGVTYRDTDIELIDELTDAYTDGASEAFWMELEAACQRMYPDKVELSVCCDCRIMLEKGDTSDIPDEDVPNFLRNYQEGTERELDGRPGHIVNGGEHNEGCAGTDNEKCECEDKGFSLSPCQLCGSPYGGSRYQATVVFND